MIRKRYTSLLLLTLAVACQPKPSAELDVQQADTVQSTTLSTQRKLLNLDVDQYEVLPDSDSSIKLPPIDFVGVPQEREAGYISKAHGVSRAGNDLVFTLKNGKQITLTNDLESEEDMVEYIFIGTLEGIGYWEVLAFYYESSDYVLINQTTGKLIHVWNKPVVSPNHDYILVGSVDIEAGFIPNGFQLWQVSGDSLSLQWQKELQDWSAERLVWTKDNFVLGEQMYRDNVSGELKKRRIKMRMYKSNGQ